MGMWNGKRPGSDGIGERIGNSVRSTTGECERQLDAESKQPGHNTSRLQYAEFAFYGIFSQTFIERED